MERHAWREAFDPFSVAEDDLDALAEAIGQMDYVADAYERAHTVKKLRQPRQEVYFETPIVLFAPYPHHLRERKHAVRARILS